MYVSIATPTGGLVHASYVASLPQLILYFLQTPVKGRELEQRGVAHQMVIGAGINQNRENMVDEFLEKKDMTHLLFIDDDMGFQPDCLNIALARQLPIVVGNYRRKVAPYTFLSYDNGAIVTRETSVSLEKCHFGGFGFCLIERQVLEAIQRPRFLAYYIPELKTYTTEDLPFFENCHKAGFDSFVDHDVSKKIWHNGSFPFHYNTPLVTKE